MGSGRTISAGDFGVKRCRMVRWLLAVGIPAGFAAGTCMVGAQTAPRFNVDVRLVDVFVNVTNVNGAPVAGLSKQDFALDEDGRPQQIAYFERDTSMPLSVVMAIDTSGSTRKDLPLERDSAREFVHALLRPVDRMDLMDFNSGVREVVAYTNDIRRIDAGLNQLDYGMATALYDAVDLASQSLAPRRGRKVLVLISDGGDDVSKSDYPQALEEARRGEVMVYSIIDVPIMADAGRDTDGEHALITLSEETGGKYYYANSGHLAEAFQKVSEDLRTQYLLGYYPDGKAHGTGFRRISVKLTNTPQADGPYAVQNRTGYYPDSLTAASR